jgi:hypothetical protein
MGTTRLNIWIRNAECNLIETCWRTDLVVQACTGKYLVDSYPEIIDQLQLRYGTPAHVKCTTGFPLGTDQSGRTVSFQVGTAAAETLTFSAPAMTLAQIYAQMAAFFTNVVVDIDDGVLCVTSRAAGPDAQLTVGGDCDLTWGPVRQGAGWKILKHYYQGAWRIMLYPGGSKTLNHIEMDVPPGCYRLWTRVCHGNNEETSVVMVNARCAEHHCVNLLLPTVKTCAAHLIHPLMDRVVFEQFLVDDAERVLPFRALMWGAGLGKAEVQAQLAYRYQEAVEKGDAALQDRIAAVQALAQLLPECY